MAPLPVCPSPKFQAYEAMVPSGSLDADPSTATWRLVAVAVNDATGGWFGGAVVVTWCCTELVAPWLSVTVSVTVKVDADA